MTEYLSLRPEVPGQIGENTIADFSVRPVMYSRLHYEFDGWLGDELLTSIGSFIVSDRLAKALEDSGLERFEFREVEVTTSFRFEQTTEPDTELPNFQWLFVDGTAGIDDIGLNENGQLVVSEVALNLLSRFPIDHCEVNPFPS